MTIQTPASEARLALLMRRREQLNEEIAELRHLLGLDKRRSRLLVPECGTETAYQRHIYRRRKFGEGDPCEPCRAAHAEHNRMKSAG